MPPGWFSFTGHKTTGRKSSRIQVIKFAIFLYELRHCLFLFCIICILQFYPDIPERERVTNLGWIAMILKT